VLVLQIHNRCFMFCLCFLHHRCHLQHHLQPKGKIMFCKTQHYIDSSIL
jgi:hypothetical protein